MRFRFEIFRGSHREKKRGASSASHRGSMTQHSRMYSLLVNTSSWYTIQSGCRWNRLDAGWMYVGVFSTTVLYPSCGSFFALWKKNPLQIARRILLKFLPADTTSSLYRSMIVKSCFRTSWPRRNDRAWRKFSKHHGEENFCAFHDSYTVRSERWSPSGWKNFAFF
eukprot:29026-Pelagococcus_subviridis.AAC.8